MGGDPGDCTLKWQDKYGSVFRFASPFGGERVHLADAKALTHVLLLHPYSYKKPDQVRMELELATGHGILTSEGESHKKQKRVST